MATVFFSLNGKTAALRTTFRLGELNGVIFCKRPVINQERTAKCGADLVFRALRQKVIRMLRLLKIIFVLLVVLAAAVIGYAYLGDLSAEQSDVSTPVTLDGN